MRDQISPIVETLHYRMTEMCHKVTFTTKRHMLCQTSPSGVHFLSDKTPYHKNLLSLEGVRFLFSHPIALKFDRSRLSDIKAITHSLWCLTEDKRFWIIMPLLAIDVNFKMKILQWMNRPQLQKELFSESGSIITGVYTVVGLNYSNGAN